MPKPRRVVHEHIQDITGYGDRVYYNPPPSLKMQYPCIVYNLANLAARHADNIPYKFHDMYSVTHIYTKTEQEAVSRKLREQPGFLYDRSFVLDNLHHDVFTLTVL